MFRMLLRSRRYAGQFFKARSWDFSTPQKVPNPYGAGYIVEVTKGITGTPLMWVNHSTVLSLTKSEGVTYRRRTVGAGVTYRRYWSCCARYSYYVPYSDE